MKHLNLWIILSGIMIAAITRIAIPFNKVFTDHGIMLNTPDAYGMIRYADMMPYSYNWDYFSGFPAGPASLQQTVFPALIATFGNFSRVSYTFMAAIIPIVLFAITLYCIYHIALNLFGNRTAAISTFIFCIMPGEILSRTSLGSGDYHCWEIFLVSTIMLLLTIAIKSENSLTTRVIVATEAIMVGIIYWLSWTGAPMILLIIAIAVSTYLFFKLCHNTLSKIIFIDILIITAVLLIGLTPILQYATILQVDLAQTTVEEFPLFFTAGQFDMNTMMAYFGVTFYIVLFGIGWLAYRVIRYQKPEEILFLSWSVVTLALMIARRRFDYYFAANAAIIVAYIIVRLSGLFHKSNLIRFVIIIAAIISLPLIKSSVVQSSQDFGYPSRDWADTCQWLRNGNSDEYELDYLTAGKPPYGTFSHWNYGYWLISIGHQAVYASNGAGDYSGITRILLSNRDDYALSRLRENKMRYLVISLEMFDILDLQTDNPASTFMYRAYTNQTKGLKLVHQAGNIKTFEIK